MNRFTPQQIDALLDENQAHRPATPSDLPSNYFIHNAEHLQSLTTERPQSHRRSMLHRSLFAAASLLIIIIAGISISLLSTEGGSAIAMTQEESYGIYETSYLTEADDPTLEELADSDLFLEDLYSMQ